MSETSWHRAQHGAPSGADDGVTALDLRFLDDATTSLLGYFVQTWFGNYLGLLFDNIGRYIELGILADLARPTDRGRYSAVFDFRAIDLERLAYINGIYFYILAAHKAANHRLMHREDHKHVLYLRGYDFEGSVATEEGMAAGFSSMGTAQFTWKIGELLDPNRDGIRVFKVLSPKDVYWETVDAQRYFYDNYPDMVALARYPICSLYLNAARWQEDMLTLFDRMDHYVVYVSSITESALWELEQLDRDGRRERVTVVFDEDAIENKELQLHVRDAMREEYGDKLIWSKPGSAPEQTVADLRAYLSDRFLLTTPEQFEAEIETNRHRIAESVAPSGPDARETWIDFRFEPADAEPRQLQDFSAYLDAEIDSWTTDRGIDCLPLFLNLVQLRIFTTLLVGDHHGTGLALAHYAAVMKQTHDYYVAPGDKPGDLSAEGRERQLDMLTQHLRLAEHVGFYMLSFGRSHEFGDYRKPARRDFDAAFERTSRAVGQFFRAVIQRNAG